MNLFIIVIIQIVHKDTILLYVIAKTFDYVYYLYVFFF